jgi:hypothetical protein
LAKIIEETNEPKTEEKDVDVIDKKIEQKPLEEMPSYRVYDSKLEFPETVIDLDLNQMPAEKSEVLDKNKILFYMTKNIDGNPHHGAVFASDEFVKAGKDSRKVDAEAYNELVSKGMNSEEAFWRAYFKIKE